MSDAPAARTALKILTLLAAQAAPMPAAAIVRDLGLPRASVYRVLAILVEQGYVSHLDDTARYGLGAAAFELGFAYTRQGPLGWIGHHTLARLVDATGESGHFAVLHGRDVLYLVEERAPGRPSLVTDVGVRLPATLTATGLAMLAALPDPQVAALYPADDNFVRRHRSGPRSLAELQRELGHVRRRGYGLEDGAVTPGYASVGVAVRDHHGHPLAALALTFPSAERDTTARQSLAGVVQAAAARTAQAIGGRASSPD